MVVKTLMFFQVGTPCGLRSIQHHNPEQQRNKYISRAITTVIWVHINHYNAGIDIMCGENFLLGKLTVPKIS